MPSEKAIAEMGAEFPHVDLQAEHRKFVDFWTDKTGKDATKITWEGTWRNWIRRAGENPRAALKVVNGSPVSTSDLRVAQVQALKQHPPTGRLELE
jgi:hypothetical protein